MDLGSILLLFALLVLVAGFVLRPLQELSSKVVGETEREHSAQLAERDRLLDALAELDFDKELGKIPDEIYTPQRENLLRRGAAVLRNLDAFQNPGQPEGTDGLDELIAARRAVIAAAAQDDPLEAMIAGRKQSRAPQAGSQFCPDCGERVIPGDRFCVKCGAALS